ncbi:MAG: hypothetical protein K6U08_09180 [Firmicutes bacterium]|nr:hypothetical protein [Bacillota bacterium]
MPLSQLLPPWAFAVTAVLVWLAHRWTVRARHAPAGDRLYIRAVAAAVRGTLVLWLAGAALLVAGSWLLPAPPWSAPRPAPQPAPESPSPAPAPPTVPAPGSGADGPAQTAAGGDEELEFTLQPEPEPQFAAALAAAEKTAERARLAAAEVVLESGDIRLESLDPAVGVVRLVNRSAFTVDLGGWSLLLRYGSPGPGEVRDAGAPGQEWVCFPKGLLIGPGERLPVLPTVSGAPPVEAVLFGPEGRPRDRLPEARPSG